MEKLHDWHVTAYMLAVHGRIDMTQVREVDGRIVVDNDPDKEALCKAIDEDNRVMIERLHRQTEEAWQQRCEKVDTLLQAALAPPPPPRTQSVTQHIRETSLECNKRRYQMCIDAGLAMPKDDYAHLPTGIKVLADREGISTQAFSKSVKKHIAASKR
jgi:hypothetical protein